MPRQGRLPAAVIALGLATGAALAFAASLALLSWQRLAPASGN